MQPQGPRCQAGSTRRAIHTASGWGHWTRRGKSTQHHSALSRLACPGRLHHRTALVGTGREHQGRSRSPVDKGPGPADGLGWTRPRAWCTSRGMPAQGSTCPGLHKCKGIAQQHRQDEAADDEHRRVCVWAGGDTTQEEEEGRTRRQHSTETACGVPPNTVASSRVSHIGATCDNQEAAASSQHTKMGHLRAVVRCR